MIFKISLPNSTSYAWQEQQSVFVARYNAYKHHDTMNTHQTVERSVSLIVNATTLALPVLDSSVNQTLVSGLVGGGENERRVGGSILWLVDVDSCPMFVSRSVQSKRAEGKAHIQNRQSRRRQQCRSA